MRSKFLKVCVKKSNVNYLKTEGVADTTAHSPAIFSGEQN